MSYTIPVWDLLIAKDRLSRPTLATQHPLPNSQDLGISPTASLAYPSQNATKDNFILSPVLKLPEAFGSAYVGETFSCTLCANNELDASDITKAVSGVRIQGDMQTPSNPTGSPLELAGSHEDGEANVSPRPGESLQRILRFELKEEGNHVLAVTVTYTETALGEGRAASGRVRTFRKLYQFVAQPLLSVRTKAGEVSQRNGMARYLLEAQLENMGEAAVCLEVSCLPCYASIYDTIDYPCPRPARVAHSCIRNRHHARSLSGPVQLGLTPIEICEVCGHPVALPIPHIKGTMSLVLSYTDYETGSHRQRETTAEVDIVELGHASVKCSAPCTSSEPSRYHPSGFRSRPPA